jgi:hypothetical protein
MANPLSQIENLAEHLVEGTFARMMGARLQPIEVARHIARAMEDGQVIDAQGQAMVPNAYLILLHPDDLAELESYKETLTDELARYVLGLARAAGVRMPGRPRVFLQDSPDVPPRRVRIQARLMSASRQSVDLSHTQELHVPSRRPETPDLPQFALYDGYRRMPISEAVISVGRDLDNDIILDDMRVSRRHAQLRRRYGQYVLYDLDSSGGTAVNGRQVREAALERGDVLSFAGVKVRFE